VRRLLANLPAAVTGYVAASLAAGFSHVLLLAGWIELVFPGSSLWPWGIAPAAKIAYLAWVAIVDSLKIAVVALVPSAAAVAALIATGRTGILPCLVAATAVGVLLLALARHDILPMLLLRIAGPGWLIVSSPVAGAVFRAVFGKLAPKPPECAAGSRLAGA
jgi:hypothetical protein